VALKILLAGPLATEEQRRRFLNEASISRVLDHPGIVAAREVRESEGHLFLVMDFVDGSSLATRLRADPIRVRELAEWLRQLADAVAYAHARGVLHRDLKPGNILIDRAGRARILDFGLATLLERPVDASLTSSGAGTLSYLAPEQVSGRRGSPGVGTDIHGLGTVLYHGLTGRPPFVGEDAPAVFRAILEEEVLPPRRFRPALPAALETICLKCLCKEPARRYSSAAELRDDLGRFLDGTSIRARPIGHRERIWRWCRRRPLAASLIVATTAAAVLAVGLGWQLAMSRALQEQLQRTRTVSISARADALLASGKTPNALGELGRHLLRDPDDAVASARLLGALTWRDWPLPLRAIGPHPGNLLFSGMTADGRRLVTADQAGNVRAWDPSGNPVGTGFQTPGPAFEFSRVTGWFVSPESPGRFRGMAAGDGRTISLVTAVRPVAFALSEGVPRMAILGSHRVELLDLETGQAVVEFDHPRLEGAERPLEPWESPPAMALSDDGLLLATTWGGTIRWWDCASGRLVLEAASPVGIPLELRFGSEAKALFAVGHAAVAGWELAEHRWTWQQPVANGVESTGWSRDRRRLAVFHGGGTRGATVLDTSDGRVLREFPKNLAFQGDAPFTPDGSGFLACDAQQSVGLHDLGSVPRRRESWLAGTPIEHAEVSPDGTWGIVAARRHRAYLVDLRPGAARPVHVGATGPVLAYQATRTGDAVLTALASGVARIWRTIPLQPAGPELRQTLPITAVALSSDGQRAVTASSGGEIVEWDPVRGVRLGDPFACDAPPARLRLGPDGRTLAILTDALRLWLRRAEDTAGNFRSLELFPGGNSRAHALRFDVSGELLVIATDRGVAVVDVPRARLLWTHEGTAWDADFSPDGRHVAHVHSILGQAWVRDARTGAVRVGPLHHADFAIGVAFHPRWAQLVTTGKDGLVRVWSSENGTLLRTLSGHTDGVRDVRCSNDGRRMTTASMDNTVRIWDSEFGLPLGEFLAGHGGSSVSTADFADGDRRLLVFSNQSKGLSVWPAESASVPVPPWLPDLALWIAGERNHPPDADAGFEPVARFLEFRQRLATLPGDDFYSRWARWFFADRATRTPFPE
jgi:WD40 repeat protein